MFSFSFQCLDKEYLNQAIKALNCSPPYITSNKSLWCKENMVFGENDFLLQIEDDRVSDGRCLKPCKSVKYVIILS